jgi:hypothetical protein
MLIAFSGGGGDGWTLLGCSFSLFVVLRVEEGGKGEGFGRELSVGGTEGLKAVVRGLLVEEGEELGGGGVGVSRWSLGALKSNVAACK